eukprot:CAMPEP_0174258880 /NCGR_PEP_ID=MMETSP0439-20130205/7796_1 /TAXON_ID=0 /ORGANISM="Stereomyxa ramosa, Strain Chinc5" /LENGTH=348 /DNA_ID=CAMNT_0015342555 /DNA_START=260 /DNA_END=1303 /DNA_ORIENTATION=-
MDPRDGTIKKQKKQMITEELLSTEKSYIEGLSVVVNILATVRTKGMLSDEDIKIIFRNIESIYHTHQDFYKELVAVNKRGGGLTVCVRRFVPFMKIYTSYIDTFDYANQRLSEIRQNSKYSKFNNFLKEVEEDPINAPLPFYLIQPVQRLPRYELMLKELLGCYPPSTSRAAEIQLSLDEVRGINQHVNRSKKTQEDNEILYLLHDGIQGKFNIFSNPARKLVKEGFMEVKGVSKVQSEALKKMRETQTNSKPTQSAGTRLSMSSSFVSHHFFLFNDLFLEAAKSKDRYRMVRVYELNTLVVINLEFDKHKHPGTETLFVFAKKVQNMKKIKKQLLLNATSPSEKSDW